MEGQYCQCTVFIQGNYHFSLWTLPFNGKRGKKRGKWRVFVKKVLVVDDDPSIHKLIQRLVSSKYLVWDAYDGEEALGLISEKKPDLIILDLMMPKLSGIEVCQRLKSNPKTQDIMILFLSARGSQEDKLRGLALGADDYVSKPFHVDELYNKINDLLCKEPTEEVMREALPSS